MSDLPRVLLCAFDVVPAPTGTSRRITDYLKALNGRFSVVAMTTKTPDVSHIERYQGARLLRVPVGTGDLVSRVQAFERAVRRQLESEEFALVHSFDPFAGYALAELRGDYGYRVLYEAHAFPSLDLRFTQPQMEDDRRFIAKVRRQELFCLLNADAVLTSSALAAGYLEGLGVRREHLHLVRAPVELAPYHARATDPDGSPMRILYVGSQVPYQGLPTLLRAVRPLVSKGEARLTMLGPRHPDWQPRLEDLVNDLGLHGRVDLHPPVPYEELPRILAASDVTVLPLEDEERTRVFGGSLAKASEYLAAGRPVVASDLPVTRELLPDSCTIFVPPGDATALGAALRELLENLRRRVELGRMARAEAARLVDSTLVRSRLLSLYAELLGRPRSAVLADPAEPQGSGDLTATPTSKVFGSGRTTSPDSASRRTPISDLSRHPPGDRIPGDAPGPDGSVGLAFAGDGTQQRMFSATLEAAGSLLPARDATDPAARVPSDDTPHAAPAQDEPTAIVREPPDDPGDDSDSNITSPGAPIPVLEPLERAVETGPREVVPSVVVAPGVLAEAARLGVMSSPPTAPSSPAVPTRGTESDLDDAAAGRTGTEAVDPARPAPLDLPRFAPGLELQVDPSSAELPPLPVPPPFAGTGASAAAVTPPHDVRSTIAALLRNHPTEPREAVSAPSPPDLADEPEEVGPEDVVAADGDLPLPAAQPASTTNAWLAQVLLGYCPPEGDSKFSRHTPPTTMPGRDPRPTPTFAGRRK